MNFERDIGDAVSSPTLMSDFWTFLVRHPAYSFWALFILLVVVNNLIWSITKHILLTLRVWVRGWPPEHVDAYGCFKSETKDTEEEEEDE